jgi:hypothetical protein
MKITRFQHDPLHSLFIFLWASQHDKDEQRTPDEFRKECAYKATELDELEIPWAVQNTIACAADKRSNGFIYFRTVLANCNIEVVEDAMTPDELLNANKMIRNCDEVTDVQINKEAGSLMVRFGKFGCFSKYQSILAVRLAFRKYQPAVVEIAA